VPELPVHRLVLSLLVIPLALVAACNGGSAADSNDGASQTTTQTTPSTDSDPSAGGPAASGELTGVTVTGAVDTEPKVDIDTPYSVDQTTVQVLEEGDGAPIADGNQVTIAYVLANGGTGRVLDSSYERSQPLVFQMQSGGIIPGLYSGLLGQSAGSRVAIAVPPDAGFGAAGNPQLGIEPGQTLVFVATVENVTEIPDTAQGEQQPPPADLPTLEVDGEGVPQRFVADGDELTDLKELEVATVIEGEGPKVQPGQTLTVQYLGQLYPDGEIFDQSWTTGQPFGFQLGTGGVIPGWDQGLSGQRVGSRVILAIPSDLGYGEQGSPPSIPADADLIFSVDILAAG